MRLVPAAEYTDDDLCNTIRELGALWDGVMQRADVTSIHNRYRFGLGATLARVSLAMPTTETDVATALRAAWNPDVRIAAEEIVNDAMRLLFEASRARQRQETRVATQHGVVQQLNSSAGGVPKTPIEHARIGPRGIAGDKQKSRIHHGRPWQALCLWSAEVIEQLQAEGHPIHFGAAGENITLRGITWTELLPGTILRIGSAVAQVSIDATPCKKNATWFTNGDFNRMGIRREPGVTRMYASVLESGDVRVGDPVVLEPTDCVMTLDREQKPA
jgi:MOSC domain-containing protein YiiM